MTYREAIDENIRRFYKDHTVRYTATRKPLLPSSNEEHEKGIPGNILHISIPAGTEFELANLLEITSPEGISLDASIPLLKGDTNILASVLTSILSSIRQAGGSIEIIQS